VFYSHRTSRESEWRVPRQRLTTYFFADDSLLFVKASVEGAGEVEQILDLHCQASGQQINFDKSSIYFNKGCPESLRATMKEKLHVQNETLSDKYLGMPSNVGRCVNGAFKYLRDGIWKHVQLAGKLSIYGRKGNIDKIRCSVYTNLLYVLL
jgi:hypothetical protein